MRKVVLDDTSTMQESTIGFNAGTEKMLKDRFGMFIHFGVYSIYAGWYNGKKQSFGGGEWIMRFEEIPLAEYQKTAYDFKPNPDWAEKLAIKAKAAGIKYAVLTTKHHDGFCLFKSNYSVYNSFNFNGRDLVREYVDAMRKYGIEPGFYYSHALDWAEIDGAGQINLAFRGNPAKNDNYWDYPDRESKDFKRYFYGKCIPQVKELLSNYGDVYLMWFDFAHDITLEQSKELYELVKEMQPRCLVNSRVAHGFGDYNSFGDNGISTVPMGVPCECLITLNDTWGYKEYDDNWKTDKEVLSTFVECISGNSTFLMNVGPMANGDLPKETNDIITALGDWVHRNERAIYQTKETPFKCGFDWGKVSSSADGKSIFLYVTDKNTKTISFSKIEGEILDVRELGGESQKFDFVDGKLDIYLETSSEIVPVIAIDFSSVPKFEIIPVQHGKVLMLNPIYSKKYRQDGDVHVQTELVLQHNIYDPMWGRRGLCLDRNSSIFAWASEKEYVEWTAEFVERGEYVCEIVTVPLGGEAEVIVEIDGKAMTAAINNEKAKRTYRLSRTGDDNIRHVFELGKVKVEKGERSVFLKRKGDGHNIGAAEIRFVKV